jgi:hypothetical protein
MDNNLRFVIVEVIVVVCQIGWHAMVMLEHVCFNSISKAFLVQ